MKHLKDIIQLSAIGILIVALLFKDGCGSGKPVKVITKDTTIYQTRDIIQYVPSAPVVKFKDKIIYHDTGRLVTIKGDTVYVPDTSINDLINDYFAERFYEDTVSGQGWRGKLRDTVFMNRKIGFALVDMQVDHREIVKYLPPKRKVFIGGMAGYYPGALMAGPKIDYLDKRDRLFTGSVMAGPNGIMYMGGLSVKIKLSKK